MHRNIVRQKTYDQQKTSQSRQEMDQETGKEVENKSGREEIDLFHGNDFCELFIEELY